MTSMLYLFSNLLSVFEKLLPGTALTRRTSTTSCHQIQLAIIGVIGVGLEGVWDCYWLVKESKNCCTERHSFPRTPDFCFFLCQLRLLHKGFSPCRVPPVKEIALTSSIYCFHMRAVISLANGNETQNCNKWGHATECRCSLLLAQSTHARSN